MTTVDVSITDPRARDRLSLHNVMWGPATRVLHAFGHACMDGRIQCPNWNVAEIRTVTTGAIVREALETIEEPDWKHSYDEEEDRDRVMAFLGRLRDDAEYEIFALEV